MVVTMSPYGDPNERRTWLPAYAIAFEILGTFFVSMRLASRCVRSGGGFGLDDLFLSLGWVFGTGATLLFMLGALFYGLDRHISAFNLKMAVDASLNGWLSEIFYLLSTGCTKIAVLLFYRRLIEAAVTRHLRWAIYLALSFTTMTTLAFTVLLFTGCRPLEARWMHFNPQWQSTHKYQCLQSEATFVIPLSGALSVFSDAYALVIPAVLLSGLRTPMRQKAGLYVVFALGVTVIGAGIARTIFLTQAAQSVDRSWIGANTFLASTAEIHLALVCACAPSLRAIVKRFFRRPSTRESITEPNWKGGWPTTDTFDSTFSGRTTTNITAGAAAAAAAAATPKRSSLLYPIDLTDPFIPEASYQPRSQSRLKKPQSGRLSKPPRISGLDFMRGDEANGSFWIESVYVPGPASPQSEAVRLAPRISSIFAAPEWVSEAGSEYEWPLPGDGGMGRGARSVRSHRSLGTRVEEVMRDGRHQTSWYWGR